MSKNLKGKNAFTSLRINRTAEEEIKKYNNNAIHMAYSASKNNNNNNNKNISKNSNQKRPSNGFYETNNNSNYSINAYNSQDNDKNHIYSGSKSKGKDKYFQLLNNYRKRVIKQFMFYFKPYYYSFMKTILNLRLQSMIYQNFK